MKLDISVIEKWEDDIEFCLPGLLGAIKEQKSTTFLIGACIFEIYLMQGWLKKFSRRTGDADFTIEYYGDPQEYRNVCSKLLALGYRRDGIHPYRYHPQKISGTYAYVDFLAFTTDPVLIKNAQSVMMVGESFNFDGMSFAKHCPILLNGNINIPNPLAMIYLKMMSYYNSPDIRKKDFVDLVEIVLRLSTESSILKELNVVANSCLDEFVKNQIQRMCIDIENDRGGTAWDLDDIKSNMDERYLLDEFEWNDLPRVFEFFRTIVFSKPK